MEIARRYFLCIMKECNELYRGVEERYLGRLITSRPRFDSGPRNTVVTPGTSTDRGQTQYSTARHHGSERHGICRAFRAKIYNMKIFPEDKKMTFIGIGFLLLIFVILPLMSALVNK